jgi:ribosomal protein S18 acetylase RimI-like enzyme
MRRPAKSEDLGVSDQDGSLLNQNPAPKKSAAEAVRLIRHGRGAWLFRHQLGQLQQLQALLNDNSFWAAGRSKKELSLMLAASSAVVSAWQGPRLVGFGRATSDRVFRGVLWDVVVATDRQGQGLGRKLVEALLGHPEMKNVERIYLMTTNGREFYSKLGFNEAENQKLMTISAKDLK